jgi:hypothetical protein
VADLPLEVRDAIRRALGRSTDQVRKAERDAHTLYRKYGLPPDKWNSLAFHRMALDIGWARSTEAHRWAIFQRVIDAFRVSAGALPTVGSPLAEPYRVDQPEPTTRREPVVSQPEVLPSQPVATSAEPAVERTSSPSGIDVSLEFVWEQVLSAPGKGFEFPGEITAFMRRQYGGPAIYRWIAYAKEIGDRKDIYIGEAETLWRRIYNYLQPGASQQTNVRMHARFQALKSEGLHVTIQRLHISSLSLGGFTVGPSDLFNKHVRVFIEHMLVAYYTKAGFVLMNA